MDVEQIVEPEVDAYPHSAVAEDYSEDLRYTVLWTVIALGSQSADGVYAYSRLNQSAAIKHTLNWSVQQGTGFPMPGPGVIHTSGSLRPELFTQVEMQLSCQQETRVEANNLHEATSGGIATPQTRIIAYSAANPAECSPSGSSGGQDPEPNDPPVCTWEYLIVEVSNDGGNTWQQLWAGYVEIC